MYNHIYVNYWESIKMAVLSHQEEKEIVSNLTALFNGLVKLHVEEPEPHYYGETSVKITENVSRALTSIVDFETGLQIERNIAHANSIGSTELVAIGIVQYLHSHVRDENAADVLPVVYRVLEEASKTNNIPIPFKLAYKPRKPSTL